MMNRRGIICVLAGVIVIFSVAGALARWNPIYARQPISIQKWYAEQHNSTGQWCCDKNDGHPYFGGYTLNKDGSVTLDLKSGKHVISADKVLTGPNPTGHAVWWYVVGPEAYRPRRRSTSRSLTCTSRPRNGSWTVRVSDIAGYPVISASAFSPASVMT